MILKHRQVSIKNKLHCKFTVEQVGDKYISTYWYPESELEVDRMVEEFETYSGAVINMLEHIIICLEDTFHFNVKVSEED